MSKMPKEKRVVQFQLYCDMPHDGEDVGVSIDHTIEEALDIMLQCIVELKTAMRQGGKDFLPGCEGTQYLCENAEMNQCYLEVTSKNS